MWKIYFYYILREKIKMLFAVGRWSTHFVDLLFDYLIGKCYIENGDRTTQSYRDILPLRLRQLW
jgi:hypothetical protein